MGCLLYPRDRKAGDPAKEELIQRPDLLKPFHF